MRLRGGPEGARKVERQLPQALALYHYHPLLCPSLLPGLPPVPIAPSTPQRVCDGDAQVRTAARDELRKGAHCIKVGAISVNIYSSYQGRE